MIARRAPWPILKTWQLQNGFKSPLLCQLSYAGGFLIYSTMEQRSHFSQWAGPEKRDEAEPAHSILRVYRAKRQSAPNLHPAQPTARFGSERVPRT